MSLFMNRDNGKFSGERVPEVDRIFFGTCEI